MAVIKDLLNAVRKQWHTLLPCVLVYFYLVFSYILLEDKLMPTLITWKVFKMSNFLLQAINDSIVFNWLTFGIDALGAIVWSICLRKCRMSMWTLARIILLLTCLIIVSLSENWQYANLPFSSYTYRASIIAFCGLVLILEVLRLCQVYKRTKYIESQRHAGPRNGIQYREVSGYTPDNINVGSDFIGNKPYANEIVSRLQNTDLKKEAFAVGIHGNWGSGKTTLLCDIKDLLPSNAITLDYKPWEANSSTQIVVNFFDQLRACVSENIDDSLEKPITEYAKYLLSINRMDPWWAALRSLAIWHSEKKGSELRSQISDTLTQSKRPVYVFIDDLDRLDADEILEVLRIIRNTANLPNMVYISAYDKNYLIGQLSNKKISSPDLYLEKFFQIELSLPKVTTYELLELLRTDVTAMMGEEWANKVIDAIKVKSDGDFTFAHLISNFREVKRFSRLFCTNLGFLLTLMQEDDFNLSDLLWLEILHYSEPLLYSCLKNDPSKVLYWNNNGTMQKAVVNKDLAKENDRAFEGERSYGYYAVKALMYIFDPTGMASKSSVVLAQNYNRYFTFALEGRKVYHADIVQLLEEKETAVNKKIKNWLKGTEADRKETNSVAYQLSCIEPDTLNLKQWKNFYTSVFSFMEYSDKTANIVLLKSALVKEEKKYNDKAKRHDWLLKKLQKLCENYDNAKVAKWLKESSGYTSIISSDDWTGLMKQNFLHYVNHNDVDASEICIKDSTLQVILKSAITYYYEYIDDDYEKEITENLILKDVIGYFSKKKSSKKNLYLEYFGDRLSMEEQEFGMSPEEKQEQSMKHCEDIFGDCFMQHDYLSKCFE